MSLTREHLSKEFSFPHDRRAPLEIYMRRGNHSGAEYMDTIYFNPGDGSHIQTWRYGVNESLGDWFIWLQIPLHYGTYWGLGLKTLWAFLGLSIPLITITGVLMYWNRVLRHKWKRMKNSGVRAAEGESTTMATGSSSG